MKTILKNLPWIIISAVSFIIITIMDLILISMMVLIKVTRLIFIRLITMFDFSDAPARYENVVKINNLIVNYGYKYYIDLMYPTVEDDEDEEES